MIVQIFTRLSTERTKPRLYHLMEQGHTAENKCSSHKRVNVSSPKILRLHRIIYLKDVEILVNSLMSARLEL